MKLYRPDQSVIRFEVTAEEIVELINTDFEGASAKINHDGNIDITLDSPKNSEVYFQRRFEEICDVFEELFLKHAYNGLSGESFEFAFRTKYHGKGWTFPELEVA